jgi:hypothetical protein
MRGRRCRFGTRSTRITKEIDYLSIPNRCKTYVMCQDLFVSFYSQTRLT